MTARCGASVAGQRATAEVDMKYESARPYLPGRLSLAAMRQAIEGCRGCDLYRDATQAVFGEGSEQARIAVVGEVPGDREDVAGRPFVGAAGRVLDQLLAEVSIPRREVYVTNAVKHFKFTRRGKRRIHHKPSYDQVQACRPWLESEIAVVHPRVMVLLGSTAAQALLGRSFRVTRHRRQVLHTEWAAFTFATVHPSSVLRITDRDERHAARRELLGDFEVIADCYRRAVGPSPPASPA